MKDDKICILLRTFSKDEIKSFEKFIISPYFPHRRNLTGYLELLKKYHPQFEVTHEDFFEKLYPGKPFSDRNLKNLASELVGLAEEFLAHNYLRSSEYEALKFQAIQYKHKKLDKLFLKKHSELSVHVKVELFNSFAGFKDKEELETMMTGFYVENNMFEKYVETQSNYVGHFTASFIVRYLKCYTDNMVLKKGYGMSLDNPLFNEFINSMNFDKLISALEDKNYEYAWLIKTYYYSYLAYNNLNEKKYYEDYKKEFYNNINKFSRLEKHFMFSGLTDLHLMRRGFIKSATSAEALEIQKKMLEEEAYSPAEDAPMDIVLYRNILLLALDLKDTEWLEYFINTYTDKVSPKYRESILHFANSWLSFLKKDFDEALTHSNKINYDFFMFKIDVKLLLLSIYYELELYEQAYSLLDAYKHFAADTGSRIEDKKKVREFEIKQYQRLLNAKTSEDYSDIEMMIDEIKKTGSHYFKNWLIEKGKLLIKK